MFFERNPKTLIEATPDFDMKKFNFNGFCVIWS